MEIHVGSRSEMDSYQSYQKNNDNNNKQTPRLFTDYQTCSSQFQFNNDHHEKIKTISNEYALGVAFYSFLGFTITQAAFATYAKSSAMIADTMAMFVDVATYLFNLLAERMKNAEIYHTCTTSNTDQESLHASSSYEINRRKIRLLYLELIPPLISVSTLLIVTINTLKGAISTFTLKDEVEEDDQPHLVIMMTFSSINLLIDLLNVSCFARAKQSSYRIISCGTEIDEDNNMLLQKTNVTNEDSSVSIVDIENVSNVDDSVLYEDDLSYEDEIIDDDDDDPKNNLNMCSAWTVSVAE